MIDDKESMEQKFELKAKNTIIEDCKHCICDTLANLVEEQRHHQKKVDRNCTLQDMKRAPSRATVPCILQTPYGHPFFTWGKVGSEDCFVTVFFKVIKVDCKENCAVLQLLKPNISIIDPEADCVEPAMICDVDFVTETNERILVDLSCYSAIKLITPNFVKHQ